MTPLSPTDWKLIFDGKTVSARPVDRQLELSMQIALLDQE